MIAILVARMASQRLPGKAMKMVEDKPVLEHLIERVRIIRGLDDIYLATSRNKENEVLIDLANRLNLKYYAGEEDSVMERFIHIIHQTKTKNVVRITADNLLIDIPTAERMISAHLANSADYTYIVSLPLSSGIMVEILSSHALCETWRIGEERHKKDAVTLFLMENPQLFKFYLLDIPEHLYRPGYRLCIDEQADLDLIRAIFKRLYRKGEAIDTSRVIQLLDQNPELARINNMIIPKDINKYWESLNAKIKTQHKSQY